MSAGDPYSYADAPGVLKKKFGIKDAAKLDAVERVHVVQRIKQGAPGGKFDLDHLKAIHKHLFQDVYAWAGKIRTVELAKGGHHFQPVGYIETGIANIHGRIAKQKFFVGSALDEFAKEVARIIGDLNYVHPFREGNGRTQLQYLKLLSRRAGHRIDLTRLKPADWQDASRAAHDADYSLMEHAIAAALLRRT